MTSPEPRAASPLTASPLTADEIAAVRKPYRAASLLPGRAYHDPQIHEFERQEWFRRDWIVVGREEDAPSAGTYFTAELDDEPLLIARGRDGELRAFYNVCRHRGTAVVEEPCGKAVRFQCPYHAWIYDLEGNLVRAKHTDDLDDFSFERFGLVSVRMETWQGFVFVSLAPEAPPLVEWLGDLPPHLARFDFSGLRVAHTVTYEVDSELEVHRRELQRVLPLPGHPPPAQQADAVRPGRRLRPDRAVAGRLDGARRDRRDDGDRRRPPQRPAGDRRHDAGRRAADLLLPDLALDVHLDPPRLRAGPPARAGRRRPHPDRLRVAVRARDDRGAGLRPVATRSRSGT